MFSYHLYLNGHNSLMTPQKCQRIMGIKRLFNNLIRNFNKLLYPKNSGICIDGIRYNSICKCPR